MTNLGEDGKKDWEPEEPQSERDSITQALQRNTNR